jgi:hypothetical protein
MQITLDTLFHLMIRKMVPKQGSHKRQPKTNQYYWGFFLSNFESHPNPVKWINRIDADVNGQVGRGGIGAVLRFAREQEGRVLERKKYRWLL